MTTHDSKAISWLTVAVLAGLLAGALDITAAVVTNALRGFAPIRTLQSVASGLLGQESFAGGAATAGLGLVLHFAMMLLIAVIYCAIAGRIAWLRKSPFIAGPLWGVWVYAVMNIVVVPLSAFPKKLSYPPSVLAVGIAIHIVCIGLPMALMVARYRRTWEKRA